MVTLRPNERDVLFSIYENEGTPIYKTAYKADVSQTAIYRIIEKLLGLELIYIKRLNNRSKNLYVTEKGKELIRWKKV